MSSGALLWLLACAAGVSVANLYYSQPLLAILAAAFQKDAHAVGLVPTLTQVGYAAGMLLVVPLGDSAERRMLIVCTAAASTVTLLCVALAPSFPLLLAACFALGLATSMPQLVVPYAAGLVPPGERGRSVGKVMSGLLIGILLSRTASGLIGAHLGFRAVYFLAAALMAGLTVLLRFALPRQAPAHALRYVDLLRSLPVLLRREPLLRRHALLGALSFASFSAFWTTLVFLLGQAPHRLGSEAAGLFGVVGVVGAILAPLAGRLADRRGSRAVNLAALVCCLAGWLVFAVFWRSLFAIGVGVVLLDLGCQANHIGNQARVLGLSAPERNRMNTVYMVAYFGGGAMGSLLGASAYAAFGWTGTCAVGAAVLLVALGVFFGFEGDASLRADEASRSA